MFETLHSNSSNRTQILPPYFLISVSYKPNNNTAVRLLSIKSDSLRTETNISTPLPNNSDAENLTASPPTQSNTSSQSLSSIMLTSTVTYLHSGVFSDLWRMSNLQHHTITLMVSNGRLSSCLNDDFQPAVPSVSLWNPSTNSGPLKVDLSSYLHSLASVVGSIVKLEFLIFQEKIYCLCIKYNFCQETAWHCTKCVVKSLYVSIEAIFPSCRVFCVVPRSFPWTKVSVTLGGYVH